LISSGYSDFVREVGAAIWILQERKGFIDNLQWPRSLVTVPSNFLTTLIGLIILWVIASIPVYIAAKVLTGGKAGFGSAMGATLGGVIVYALVFFGVNYFLGSYLGSSAGTWALILAFIAWLAVYRASFDVGWLKALGIAIFALIVLIIVNAILGSLFGASIPDLFPSPL